MTRHTGGFDCLFHDAHGQALEFQVQLEAGDTFLRAGDFAIHVTEGVFPTHDVGQDSVIGDLAVVIEVGANTNADTSTRALHFHARVH